MKTDELINKVEEDFKRRCIKQNIKFQSKKFYEFQCEFFIGAASVLEGLELVIPPKWIICIMSGREIIEY